MEYNNLDIYWQFYNLLIKNSAMSYGLTIAKAITSLLLVIQAARLYFSSYKVTGEAHSHTYYELFRPFFLIITIVSYSYIVDTFDSVAVESEKYIYNSFKVNSTITKDYFANKPEETKLKEGESNSLVESVSENVSTISTYMKHPSLLFVQVTDYFMSLLDSLVYTFVIIVRFAFLFILRFLGPFALAFSIYHRFEGWWANWAKAYGMLYLWVIVIFLINFFANGIAHGVYKLMTVTTASDAAAIISYNSTVWCLVLVKVYLYFKSKNLLYKIFA